MTLLLWFHSVIIGVYVSFESGRTCKEVAGVDFTQTSQLV